MEIYTHDQYIVSNPNGYSEGIISIISKTNDIKVLVSALDNPNLNESIIGAVISRLEFMSLQGCVTPSVISNFAVMIEAKRAGQNSKGL